MLCLFLVLMYVKPLRCAKGVTFVNIFKQFGAVYQLERVLCYSKGVSGSFYLSAPGSEVSVAGPACEAMHAHTRAHTHSLRGRGVSTMECVFSAEVCRVCVCKPQTPLDSKSTSPAVAH